MFGIARDHRILNPMTAQITDSFPLQDKKFSIAGVHGGTLFNPLDDGMQPLPRISSFWRGFVCSYKTSERKLFLDILQVNLDSEGWATNHVRPVFSNSSMFDNTYNDLNLSMYDTGELMVAEGFIHPAVRAVSPASHTDATRGRNGFQPGRDISREEVEKWITSTFRQDAGSSDENN